MIQGDLLRVKDVCDQCSLASMDMNLVETHIWNRGSSMTPILTFHNRCQSVCFFFGAILSPDIAGTLAVDTGLRGSEPQLQIIKKSPFTHEFQL